MNRLRSMWLLLSLAAVACGPSDEAAPGATEAPARADTVRAAPQVETVRQRLEQAERAAAARSRDAQGADGPR